VADDVGFQKLDQRCLTRDWEAVTQGPKNVLKNFMRPRNAVVAHFGPV